MSKKVVIGLSGGVDSSVVVAGCCSLFDTFFMPNFLKLFLL